MSRSPSVGDIDNWNAQYWAFNTDDSNMKDAMYAAELMREDGCTLLGKELPGLGRVEACQQRLCMA